MLKNFLRSLIVILIFAFPALSVQAAPSVLIQSISPSTTIYSGNAVYFTVVPSDFNGSVNYTVSDSVGSSISNSNINSSGVFVWVPVSSDAGIHNITATVTDGSGNTGNATVQLTVVGPPTVTIQNLFPGTSVNVGQTVFFTSASSGLTNPVFSVSDSVASSITSNNMNPTGGFSWTPKEQDVGNHVITVTVNGDAGRSASASQSINVAIATATISSLSPGDSITLRQNVTFTVNTVGFTNPTYQVSDSFYGSGVGNGNISNSGVFNWTPTGNNTGEHLITIVVSDASGNRATVSQKINVSDALVTINSIFPSKDIVVGTPFSFIASSTGFTNPVYTVSDTFSGSSITGSMMNNASSTFKWTPTGNDVGTHYLTLRASDNLGNTGTANLSVTVRSLSNPVAASNSNAQPTSQGVAKYIFSNYLAIGSRGNDVSELQKILIQKGYLSGAPTGYYGTLTANAVKLFQSANGLSPLGYVGPGTRSVLNGSSSSGATTPPTTGAGSSVNKYIFTKALGLGSTGEEVTELQKKLTSLGLYTGPITGTFGPLTRSAVMSFQAKYGLSQVGNVGPATRNALNGL